MHIVLDPRTKVLATIILIIATFLTEQVSHFIGITCLLILVLLTSKAPLRMYLRNIFLLSWLLVFTFLAHLWGNTSVARNGIILWKFPMFGILLTYDDLFSSLLVVGRLIVIVGWVTILGSTSSSLEIVNAIECLLRPGQRFGLPVQKLTVIAMLSIRFIPILFEEGQHLIHAYIARSIDLNSGNIAVRLKNYVLLCDPLFNSMLRRVEHLTLAMESRSFRAGSERTSLHELRMTLIDYIILSGSLFFIVFIQLL